MDNIRTLEREWFKYKAKKVMVKVFSIIFIGILLAGIYYISMELQSNIHQLMGKKVEMKNNREHLEVNKTSNNLISNDKYEVSLEPVIPIIDMEKEERKRTHTQARRASHVPRSQEKVLRRAKPSTYLTANELLAVNNELDSTKHKKINLNGSSKNYIETMKEKFSKNKNPREALLLSKAFYADAKYKEAEHWALVANKLNNSLEESWFVFAKSKAKLGQKDEAIKILASYYKKRNSEKAKLLIEKIKKGNL